MKSEEDRSLKTRRPDLFAQINHELTKKHYPKVDLQTITYGSKKKIWWNCPKDSRHVWDTGINERAVAGKGCLVCAGYRVIPGINDLAFLNPTVASQWHPTKNNGVLPTEVSATTNKKIWWLCSKDSRHEWNSSIKDRHHGHGCPVCNNRVIVRGINDFATVHPELVSEWNLSLNGSLTPYTVPPSAAKKIWWNCPKDERHIYRMSLNDRHNGHGCTVCCGRVVIQGVNDAATHYPEIAAEWHPTKNSLAFTEVTPMSLKSGWWVCKTDPSHEWKTTVASRTRQGSGCPTCAGRVVVRGVNDLLSQNPKVAAQWHPTLNKGITPEQVHLNSSKKFWWKCDSNKDHVWEAVVNNRNDKSYKTGTGCPKCKNYYTEESFRKLFNSMTDLEFVSGKVPVKWSKWKVTQIDLLNEENKICIEYDGLWSHGGKKNSPFSLEESLDRDVRKTQALLDAGYKVIRIREEGLPDVPLIDPRFFQTACSLKEDKKHVVGNCLSWMRV